MINSVGQAPYNTQTSYQGWLKNAGKTVKKVGSKVVEVSKKAVTIPEEIKEADRIAAKHSSDILHGRKKPNIVAEW